VSRQVYLCAAAIALVVCSAPVGQALAQPEIFAAAATLDAGVSSADTSSGDVAITISDLSFADLDPDAFADWSQSELPEMPVR